MDQFLGGRSAAGDAQSLSEGPGAQLGDQAGPTAAWSNALDAFRRSLEAKNRSPRTLQAYGADLRRFVAWLDQTTYAPSPDKVERADVVEYMSRLASKGLRGVSRARKLSALRELFRFLEANGELERDPTKGIEMPKKERQERTSLRPDEYRGLLAAAGANPRDFAILQVFLQTGIRVSELVDLRVSDVDFGARMLTVRGKGLAERQIELEKRGLEALRHYLDNRADSLDEHLFLNRYGTPLSDRGVRKLVAKYRARARIKKPATPHSFRHTFASHKADHGVSPFRLQQWLGHAHINTTQIYVHLSRKNARRAMESTSLT